MYEVLDYGSTLELRHRDRKRATRWKREKVHYLQDHIIAYQDKAATLAQIHTLLAQLEKGWEKKCPFSGHSSHPLANDGSGWESKIRR